MAYHYTIVELERMFKKNVIRPRFRFSMLNPDETVSYVIPDEDVSIEGTSYNEQYQVGVRRTMSLELINTERTYTPNINGIWANAKISYEAGIERTDGTILWFPAGIYIVNSVDTTREGADQTVMLSLSDKFSRFEGKMGTLEGVYEIPQGSLCRNVIQELLTLDAGDGAPLDIKPIILDEKLQDIVTPYTITKEAGSSISEIFQDLAVIMNAEMFYNEEGNLTFLSVDDTTDDLNKPTLWIYKDIELEYGGQSINFNFDEVVNEVHVIGTNINSDIFSAMAKNMNAASTICIQRIGRRIEVIEDSNIYSDQLALERANYELRLKSIFATSVNIKSAYLPFLNVNNLVEIQDDYYSWKREKFIIQSISYGLDSPEMTIALSNMSNLPTFTKGIGG